MTAARRAPASTYRLQVTSAFDLHAAADLVGYLRDLGADAVYLSPLLTATPDSAHGYDVVDHARVDPARGGEAGLDALAAAAHEAGLRVLVDIVPNHVGVSAPNENAWWWDVLRHGPSSRYAGYFDIDWDAGGGRLRIPVLGATIEQETADGNLRVAGDELHHHTTRYPLAPGTADDGASAAVVHDRQHYALVDWRRADHDLNYRRFFAVSTLAAIRVEDPAVFEESHREILRWVREGLVDGIRVDHPDGLADPGGYLDRLAEATGGAYVLVEKILEHGETLPGHWATAGTTGYDALAEIDRVLVDPAGEAALDALERELGGGRDWEDLVHDTKRAIADGILGSETRRLARELVVEPVEIPAVEPVETPGTGNPGAGLDKLDQRGAVDAIAEVLACFPVYRSYLPHGAEHLDHALAAARARRPELAVELDAIAPALRDPATAVARRFQQTSGMVMAKGVEDTAFYRVSRLASLTEVGGDPSVFALTVDEFHRAQQARLAAHPRAMTTLSTHDTKRGEDTRARIHAIAEAPGEWAEFVQRRRAALSLGDGVLENLLWQSIVGCWPRERAALHGYAEKAAREAGVSTTWTDPDAGFEERLHALIDSAFDDPDTTQDVEAMVRLLGDAGRSNGLAAKLLQLAGPGVPDVYQGAELWERSLVDPDNRRPVDFAERRRMLAELDAGSLPPVDETGAAKLVVVSRTLRLRRDRPELFHRHLPLPAAGEAAEHVIAVDRGGAIAVATRLPIGLRRRGGWGETLLSLPRGTWRDAFTGTEHAGGETRMAEVLERYPVALLVGEDGAS